MNDDAPDYASAYRDLRTRVTELLRRTDLAALDAVAPATPEWRVRDIAAHLAGVCADVADGNLAGVATDAWTDAQVATRRDWSIDEILDDWETHAERIEPGLNDLGPAIGQMLADAAMHEHDIRGALGVPGARESDALIIGVDWALTIVGAKLASECLGTLRIEHEGGMSVIGEGEPTSTLRTTRFELGRAMTGRRTRAQMAAFDRDGPLDPEVLVLAAELFTPPAADLLE